MLMAENPSTGPMPLADDNPVARHRQPKRGQANSERGHNAYRATVKMMMVKQLHKRQCQWRQEQDQSKREVRPSWTEDGS